MKNNLRKYLSLFGVTALLMVSCTKDLDRAPFFEVTSASVYSNFANYKNVLAKIYAGMATTGQQGPAGSPDVSDIDEGFSNYIRTYWNLQELTTDEAVIGWNDATIQDLHRMNWTSADAFVKAMYYRIFYQITLCNEFIRETTDAKLSERNITGTNADDAKRMRAEARFMRALSYYHALDLFGNPPFVTETDPIGSFFPPQTTRASLFNYVESELKAIEADLATPRNNEYARADQAAAWFLLCKLYLNAEVYINTARYTDVITYASKIIAAGYTLEPNYAKLFLTDNHTSPEMIFAVAFDGLRTKTYGGTTFLTHAGVGGSMNPANWGIDGGWSGIRSTKNLVNLFPNPNGTVDRRGTFWTNGQNLEIADITSFNDGYPLIKYRNVSSTGAPGSDPARVFTDNDFPMMRLADVYLMYAEAVLRGGTGGSTATALGYLNALRTRAYGNTTGNITLAQMTLDFIIDERARELAWEATRRTDLIRFNRFTGSNYLWPWKGGVAAGTGVGDFRRLFPIPAADLTANPNLRQNTGY
jgi:starch-binding outer membrane protein, SusD/RagB family